jgi:hypothetical protein
MTTTPRLTLPYMVTGQAQKELTHSQGLNRLDALVQSVVQTVGSNTPPGSPAEGYAYIVGPAPTGAWASQANNMAFYIGAAWLFIPKFTGMRAYNLADTTEYRWSGAAWAAISSGGLSAIPVHKNGTLVGSRGNLNFIEGANITLTIGDDAGDDEIDITIAASGGGGGGASVTVSDTVPGAASAGDLWFKSDEGRPFIYYDDGSTSQWVDFVSPTTNTAAPVYITRVRRSTNLAVTNVSWTLITWDTDVRDDLNAHSTSSATSRITIPPGVTAARLTGHISFNSGGSTIVTCERNAGGVKSAGASIVRTMVTHYSGNMGAAVDSGWLPVTPGDYFEMFVFRDGGDGTLIGPDFSGHVSPSFFQAEFMAAPTLPPPSGGVTRLRGSANQSIPNTTWTLVTGWDTEDFDDANAHSTTTDPSRTTVPVGVTRGRFVFHPVWASSGAGVRYTAILRNSAGAMTSANIVTGSVATANDVTTASCTTSWMPVTPGDYFEVMVYQSSGGALNLQMATGGAFGYSFFTAEFT